MLNKLTIEIGLTAIINLFSVKKKKLANKIKGRQV
jgi:hypothetical protein